MRLLNLFFMMSYMTWNASTEGKLLKQRRSVDVVNRQTRPDYEYKDLDAEEGEKKEEFGMTVEGLLIDLKIKARQEMLYMFGLKVPENVGHTQGKNKPPKYMVDLYNAIADRNGLSKAPDLLDADTVRSIPNTDRLCPDRCQFDVGSLNKKEIVLDAELHVFLERPQKRKVSSFTYFIKIFQILKMRNKMSKTRKTLVAARRLPLHVHGWQIFPLLTTVESWRRKRLENLGVIIEITYENGDVIGRRGSSNERMPILVTFTNDSRSNIHISQKAKTLQLLHAAKMTEMAGKPSGHLNKITRPKRSADNRDSKKSNSNSNRSREAVESRKEDERRKEEERRKEYDDDLAGDTKQKNKNKRGKHQRNPANMEETVPKADNSDMLRDFYGSPSNYDDTNENSDQGVPYYWEYDYDYAADGDSRTTTGHLRRPSGSSFSTLSIASSATRLCTRYPLYVDFEEMGWTGWIIHPHGYNAYHCRGKCAFPLGQHLKPNNHATVQSIMHTLGLGGQPVDLPCCTPDKLYDINLLYFDQNEYVVLRRYKDMVAGSCACR
ncbi:unnamed protein product [Clavelina lepadiformis]|uniref:TGF-beta family profile domain-containing protein n=1 Tax=Clavelina lepadiformis TaxID=159417 RepID=A0ABP0G6R9_CLALP